MGRLAAIAAVLCLGMFLVIRQALAVPCQGPFVAGPPVISIPIDAGQPVHTAIPVAAWNGAGYGVAFTGLLAGKRDIYCIAIKLII